MLFSCRIRLVIYHENVAAFAIRAAFSALEELTFPPISEEPIMILLLAIGGHGSRVRHSHAAHATPRDESILAIVARM